MTLLLGVLVIAAGIFAVTRRLDVRLVLLLMGLALGALGGDLPAIARMFLVTFSNERYVVPICTAMGFAYVLKLAECDKHLVHLLIRPVTHVRPLLVPGTVVVGFVVNIPVISQTSTAVTLGSVVIPILLAARIPRVTIGAALLLGSSIGGELLNPGAPELRTVVAGSEKAAKDLDRPSDADSKAVLAHVLPLDLLGLLVSTALLWAVSARAPSPAPEAPAAQEEQFRIHPVKALIPVLPLVLLFLTAPPLRLIPVWPGWLVEGGGAGPLASAEQGLFDSRLVGAAMLIGAVVAACAARRSGLQAAEAFFAGAGYGFTHIISLIVAATCFGEGVRLIGLAEVVGRAIQELPVVLMPAAGLLSLGFGTLCGSGMATTQSLFGFFAEPALRLEIDPLLVGAVVSLGAAAGRTVSPFAAVTLMCATMTKTNPLQLVARLALPVMAAVAAQIMAAMMMASG